MGPRTGLDNVERRKILPLLGLELRHLGHPPLSQSLYRLRYPGRSLYIYYLIIAGRPKKRRSIPGKGSRFLFVHPALGPTQPFILLVPGALSPRVKQPAHEADFSLQSSATPPYVYMACSIIRRGTAVRVKTEQR
jgi:hypothetical protein